MDGSANLNEIDPPLKHVMKSWFLLSKTWESFQPMTNKSICSGILWHWDLWCSSWCCSMRPVFPCVSISMLCQSARLGQRWCCSSTYLDTTFETPGMYDVGWPIHQEWVYNILYSSSVWVCMGHKRGDCTLNVSRCPRIMWKKCHDSHPFFFFRSRFTACHQNRAYCRCNIAGRLISQSDCPRADSCFSINLSCVIVLFHYVWSGCQLSVSSFHRPFHIVGFESI